MATRTLTTAALRYLPKVIAWIDQDQAKRFDLLEPWQLNLVDELPASYIGRNFTAAGRALIVYPYAGDVCDGNTLSPEEMLGIPTVIGSLAHDPLYGELEEFAAAMGGSVRKARKWADQIYGNILYDLASREESWWKRRGGIIWAYMSYGAIRVFGGIWHASGSLLLLLCVSLALGWSGGCMGRVILPDWEEPIYIETTPGVSTNAISSALP